MGLTRCYKTAVFTFIPIATQVIQFPKIALSKYQYLFSKRLLASIYRWKLKTQSEASDRIDEESGEVGDALPLGLNERRVTVEDDVSQTISK